MVTSSSADGGPAGPPWRRGCSTHALEHEVRRATARRRNLERPATALARRLPVTAWNGTVATLPELERAAALLARLGLTPWAAQLPAGEAAPSLPLSDLPEGLLEVGEQVLGVLDPCAHPHEAVSDASGAARLRVNLPVRGGRRVADNGVGAAERDGDPGELEGFAPSSGRSGASGELEREHAAVQAAGEQGARTLVVAVRAETGVMDHGDLVPPFEHGRQCGGVLRHALHAQFQRLHASQAEPRFERRHGAPGVEGSATHEGTPLLARADGSPDEVGVAGDHLRD